jgi:shikimate kinase
LENDAARIIELGGGTWTSERNRSTIARHNALTIWLDAPFELCWQRIIQTGDNARPLARDKESAHSLYQKRRALYELAELHIRIDEADEAGMICTEILNALRRRTTKERRNQISKDRYDG